jgi:hypothetical protein
MIVTRKKELVWINGTSFYYDISREEVRRKEWSKIFLVKKKKQTQKEIKYVFNKYKRWMKILENKKEM